MTPSIELPEHLHTIDTPDVLYRIHSTRFDAVYFGQQAAYRFDAPDGAFGVLYAAQHPFGAFVETCLRQRTGTHSPVIDRRSLQTKKLTTLYLGTATPGAAARSVELFGPGMARNWANGDVGAHYEYEQSQAYSAAVHTHPDHVAGIGYLCRHDNSQLAFALYDRIANVIEEISTPDWTLDEDDDLLEELEDRYGLAII